MHILFLKTVLLKLKNIIDDCASVEQYCQLQTILIFKRGAKDTRETFKIITRTPPESGGELSL